MEKRDNDAIQAYDTLYTSNQIQILKILLPFCSQDVRKSLTVLIKFLELQYTLAFIRAHPESFQEPPRPFCLDEICGRIKGYCPPQLDSMLEQLQSMLGAFRMYEEMSKMMEVFQGMDAFSGKAEGPSAADGPDCKKSAQDAAKQAEGASFGQENGKGGPFPMDLLMGMLSPRQQELFQMFQTDLNPESKDPSQEKEDANVQSKHPGMDEGTFPEGYSEGETGFSAKDGI